MPNSTGDRKSRVLIVDDAPANLAILGQALAWDYEVSVATRGEDALRIVASQSTPDRVPMLLT
jgi:CheY-like chemotaxis protein